MAERIVSPGVFTNEVDQSFLAGGVAEIGAAIIGNTVKGPALIPTQIRSYSDFVAMFGSYTDDSYVPHVVQDYLRNGNVITVTRLLYEDGYSLSQGSLAIIGSSGSAGTATFASASGTLVAAAVDNQQFQITHNGENYIFSAQGNPVPNDPSATLYYFSTGSTATATAANLREEINNATALQSIVSASSAGAILSLTGSSAGTNFNGVTFATSSATVPNTFTTLFTLEGGLGSSATSGYVTHVLHPSQPVTTDGATNLFEDSVLTDNGSGSFTVAISGSYVAASDNAIGFSGAFLVSEPTAISSSLQSSNNTYVSKVFGKSPKSVDYPVYTQFENKKLSDTDGNRTGKVFNNMGDVTTTLDVISTYALSQDFKTAATPYITSQKIGTITKNLIKFHTLSHGTSVNHEVKIGIRDIRLASEVSDPNGYGTFTVEVRRVNTNNIENTPYGSEDTDRSPDIVEIFRNVNLDPDSAKYVSRVIGDRYQTITDAGDLRVNGDYPNLSKFIRVEVDAGVSNKTNDKTLIPFGFAAPKSPIPNTTSGLNLYPISYNSSQTPSGASYSNKNYHGFDYTNLNNLNYLAPVPTSNSTTGSNTAFYLGDVNQDSGAAFPTLTAPYSGSIQTSLDAGTLTTDVSLVTRKFIVPFQGGFDGAKPNLKKYSGTNITAGNTFGHDCSGTSTGGTKAYNKAFTLLENTDFYDINMLLTPGIIDSLHPVVTTSARNLAEERQDTFYVMDSNALTDSIDTAVTQVTSIDSNYTACYFPWVRIVDPGKNKPIFVPPSVVIPGALSFNDAVSAPWYAPAGLTRGGLTSVIGSYVNLSQKQRDTLYEARINPIANFPNEGVCIWGQKTLQGRASALDRVNVRRLLIAVKKFIASSTRYLVFEQNTSATRTRFLSIVNPYLEQVRAEQGLSAFRVVMDDTNNTPATIDRNILYGQLFLQPTRTAEFIILDFNIQPTGASFPE